MAKGEAEEAFFSLSLATTHSPDLFRTENNNNAVISSIIRKSRCQRQKLPVFFAVAAWKKKYNYTAVLCTAASGTDVSDVTHMSRRDLATIFLWESGGNRVPAILIPEARMPFLAQKFFITFAKKKSWM